jgi:hypothetical protein
VETRTTVLIGVTIASPMHPGLCPDGVVRAKESVPLKAPLGGRRLLGDWSVAGGQFLANPMPRLIGLAPGDARRLLTLEGAPGSANAPKELVTRSPGRTRLARVAGQQPAPGVLVTSASAVRVRIVVPMA